MARNLTPRLIPGYGLPLSSSESQRSRSRRGAHVRRGSRGHRRLVSGSYGYRPTVGPGPQSELLTDAVEKVPKCLLAFFSKETKLNYSRRLIWHPGRCRSRLWVFSLGDELPHIFIRESHQRPRKILIIGGKRLFQQHRPISDNDCAPQHEWLGPEQFQSSSDSDAIRCVTFGVPAAWN
jgi:hypothetical protein